MQKFMFVVLTILFFVIDPSFSQGNIFTDCIYKSAENDLSFPLTFWARTNTTLSMLQAEEDQLYIEDFSPVSEDEPHLLLPVPLSLKKGFVFLNFDAEKIIFINRSGQREELENPSEDIGWFKVGAAPDENQFYIIGWNENLQATLITVDTQDNLSIYDVKLLNFKLNPDSSYSRWILSLSPDGRYIFYADQVLNDQLHLFIYDVFMDQFVWTRPYGNIAPDISWSDSDSPENTIAIVSGTTSLTDSMLYKITHSGEESKWIDLSESLDYSVAIGALTDQTREGKFFFWLENRDEEAPFEESRLYAGDIVNNKITDLCIEDQTVSLISSLEGELISYTRPNVFPFTLRLIFLNRGVYQDLSTENYAFPFEYRTMPEGSQTNDE